MTEANRLRRLFLSSRYYGNVFWTAFFQTVVSVLVALVLGIFIAISSGHHTNSDAVIIGITLGLILMTIICARGLKPHAWLVGVRELAYYGSSSPPAMVSLRCRRREPDDPVAIKNFSLHQNVGEVLRAFGRRLILATTRRTYVPGASNACLPLNVRTTERLKRSSLPDVGISPLW